MFFMKKTVLLFISILALASVSCKKENVTTNTYSTDSTPKVTTSTTEPQKPFVFNEEEFFTLDYTPYEPEPESKAGKLSLFSPKASGKKVENIVPGLRKLSDYKTSYSTKKTEFKFPEIIKMAEDGDSLNKSKKSAKKDEPFRVSDWGPKGSIPSDVRFPSFYVLFSEPVVALASVGQEANASDYVTISPAIKGTFRWNGTSLLSFDTAEAVNPMQVYTITVKDGVKSISGKTITGEKSFSTEAASLQIIWSAPGYQNNNRFDRNEVPPEFAKSFRVQFNYPVNAEELKKISVIKKYSGGGAGIPISFNVTQSMIDTVTYSWDDYINFGMLVELELTQELNGKKNTINANFSTLSDFLYQYHNNGSSYGKYTNPVKIHFSHPVNEPSVLDAITATKASGEKMPFTKENFEVYGSTLTIFGLPVAFHSNYTIHISTKLKDVFGRNLQIYNNGNDSDKGINIQIEVPGAESRVRYTNSYAKILESQFPHRTVFEYQNIDNGAYLIEQTNRPFADISTGDCSSYVYNERNKDSRKELSITPRDERIFEIVNLDEKLLGKNGWATVYTAVKVPKKPSKWDPDTYYWSNNVTSIQVTNLGVTVRYGMNKVCALVTQLSDGKPVEGAKVFAWKNPSDSPEDFKNRAPYGITDKNGLAVIPLNKENISNVISSNYWGTPAVYVEKDDDKVIFKPEDHYPWRHGIDYYRSVPNNIESVPRIFMFSDRGLYKPGETVSFRGIDRNQYFGAFVPYEGDYTIKLMEDTWRESKEYGTITGKTTESGGFYGSFVIPEDVEPGIYKIRYERGSSHTVREMRINVAFFERLKFQSAVSMPKTPVIAGEKIQAGIGASYLAGGALSSAKFDTNWFREMWYFTSDDPEFKQYKFGPAVEKEGRSHIREDSGNLDANGNATVSCETTGNSIKGAPYRYRVSADVTDVSNQQVSASGITLVHPASFYIGLSKPEMSSAFARKGEKLTFTYKLALPDGKAVASSKTAHTLSGKDKKIDIKLTREEWNLVQQQGIQDVYSRYECTTVEESSQAISLSESGKITVTPQEPGNHKIQLSTTDSQGRNVITEYKFFVTGSGRCSWYQEDAHALRLTPDKNQYNPGETAHILLESTLPEGNYLITVEREGIYTEEVRHLEGPINVIDIPVARNYVPVFYVSISSYSVRQGAPKHEYGKADLDKPKGFYGVTEVFVNPRVKSFSVKLESKKPSYRPGEMAEVTVYATKGGKPLANAEITLMGVDRGVLDLINYHVPDPIAFFYNTSHFPLRVEGGDSRAYLMDPVTYEVKNLKGGDTGDDDKLNERSDFNPTAVFEPMLKTDENGKVTVLFKLPDTLTTYRMTAFGVNGELLALQEDEIAVQNPINIQQVLPRELRERDTAELGVLISNLDDKEHEISVSLAVKEIDATKAEENGITRRQGEAFVDGKSEHKIKVPSGANATVYFDIAAKKAGMVSTEFTIRSDILNERLICPLKIEKPYIFETVTTTGQLSEKEDSATERIAIPSYTEDMNGNLSITLDATRLGLLGEAVKYLFEYPFGCLEQETSRLLPLVIFEDYIDTFNLENKVTNIHKLVKSKLTDIKNYQHSDGGFGYWSTSHVSNLFVSVRIAHIYALAVQRGYKAKDIGIDIEKLCRFIAEESNSLEKKAELHIKKDSEYERFALYYNDYIRAYSYYVLALNGKPISSTYLDKIIKRDRQDISALALAGLASLQTEGKNSSGAKEAAKILRTYMRPTTRGVDISNPEAPHWAFAYYGDEAENLALTLQLFTQLDKDDEMNTRLIYSLMSNQRAGFWKNTAITARVLEAIYHVIKTNNLDKTNLNATALFAGKQFASGTFKGTAAKPVTVTVPFTDEKISSNKKDTELPIEFSKKGKGSLYYTTSMRYAIPQELQTAKDMGIGLVMQIFDNATGEEIKTSKENPITELESGKTYKVKITVSSSYDRDFIALRAPVPSGAEILDATFATSPDAAENASGNSSYSNDYDGYTGYFYGGSHFMSNQVIYNNEIQFFWDSFNKGTTTAEFKFRAVRRGVFPTPPANAECMYEPEIFGRTGGILYTIK